MYAYQIIVQIDHYYNIALQLAIMQLKQIYYSCINTQSR